MARPERDGPRIIDVGAHCHPDDPPENEFFHGFIDRSIGEPVYRDLDAYARRYEAAGLDGAVLSQPFYMGHGDMERVVAANDAMAEVTADRPEFYPLAAIPTAAGGEAAAAEFERCLDAGFHGGSIETETEGIELHHDEVAPILEVADEAGAPILVHPKLNDSVGSEALSDAWLLNAVFGRETALCASICKVIHTGVLDRYQDLHLVYHHTGGNIASMLGRLRNQFAKFPPAEWFDDPPEPVKTYPAFKAQLESRIFVDTSGYDGDPAVFRNALTAFPTSQLLFGTDFPFETRTKADFERMLAPVEAELPQGEAAGVLGGNALDLLVNVEG